MKQELKDKWLVALRSGEYKQGSGHLERQISGVKRYCCLGVLCMVAVEKPRHINNGISDTGYFDGNECTLSANLIAKFGIELAILKPLIIMNDGVYDGKKFVDAKSFTEIADYIEANIKGE